MKYIYIVPIPPDAQTVEVDELQQQLAQSGLLERDGAIVEQISSDAADVRIEGQWRYESTLNGKFRTELETLAESNIDAVPFYGDDSASKSGYWNIESADVDPVHPNSDEVVVFNINLKKTGTHETHFRAVRTSSTDADNPFSAGSDPEIGIPHAARKRKWADPISFEFDSATDIVETRSAEFGDIDIYNPDDAPYTDPILLYEVGFDAEAPVDPVIWDDRGRSDKFDILDEDGAVVGTSTVGDAAVGPDETAINVWRHVFSTGHEFEGRPTIDNGLIRIRFDETLGLLRAWEWNDSNLSWDIVALDRNGWTLVDFDIERIGLAGAIVQAEFEHDTDGVYETDMILGRGWEHPLWLEPENEDEMPGSLTTYLAPIASGMADLPQATADLISRSDIRQ